MFESESFSRSRCTHGWTHGCVLSVAQKRDLGELVVALLGLIWRLYLKIEVIYCNNNSTVFSEKSIFHVPTPVTTGSKFMFSLFTQSVVFFFGKILFLSSMSV